MAPGNDRYRLSTPCRNGRMQFAGAVIQGGAPAPQGAGSACTADAASCAVVCATVVTAASAIRDSLCCGDMVTSKRFGKPRPPFYSHRTKPPRQCLGVLDVLMDSVCGGQSTLGAARYPGCSLGPPISLALVVGQVRPRLLAAIWSCGCSSRSVWMRTTLADDAGGDST